MNHSARKNLICFHALRQWFARCLDHALPEHAVSAAHASAPQSVSAPPCAPACDKPKAAVTLRHPASKFMAAVQQWVAEQPKPYTLVVYVNAATTQITQFRTLRDDVVHELFTTPAYNTSATEWVRVGNDCLRRKNDDLATLFGEQEFCLRNMEDMLAARWYASESLAPLQNRILAAFETAFPAEEDITSISMAQRQAALAHFKSLLLESNKAIQELLLQDEALIPALQMLGVEVPEGMRPRKQVLHPSRG